MRHCPEGLRPPANLGSALTEQSTGSITYLRPSRYERIRATYLNRMESAAHDDPHDGPYKLMYHRHHGAMSHCLTGGYG